MRRGFASEAKALGRMNLPRYTARRDGVRVGAARIRQINHCQLPNRGAELVLDTGDTVDLPGSWLDQHVPEHGGYYVVGIGGKDLGFYVNTVTFQEGYTPDEAQDAATGKS